MKWENILKRRKIKASDINIGNLFLELLKEELPNLPRTFNMGYFRNSPFLEDIRERVIQYVVENNIATRTAVMRGFFANKYDMWVSRTSWKLIRDAYQSGELPILVRSGANPNDYTFEVLEE